MATNSQRTATQTFTVTVYEKPKITSIPVPNATVDVPYTYTVKAEGNPPPTYTLTIAPSLMDIDETTGVISWKPTTPQDEVVEVWAINSKGTHSQTFIITVVSSAPGTIKTFLPIILKQDN